MKKTRFSKIAALLLALTLAVGALLGVSVVANAAENGPTLGYANVVFGDTVQLAFTIEGEAQGIVVYEDAEGTLLFSRDTKADYTADGQAYYTSAGIAAKDIDTTYYVGVIDANGNVGALVEYSVLAYVDAMDAKTPEVAENIYAKVRAYNDAANAVFEK